jgi:hypothetical protein
MDDDATLVGHTHTAGGWGKCGLIVMSVMSGIGGGTRTQEHLHIVRVQNQTTDENQWTIKVIAISFSKTNTCLGSFVVSSCVCVSFPSQVYQKNKITPDTKNTSAVNPSYHCTIWN